MIILTRLGGRELAVNPDLIERAEPTPDTVLTLTDGRKLVVCESVTELVDLVRSWRAGVLQEALGGVRAALPAPRGHHDHDPEPHWLDEPALGQAVQDVCTGVAENPSLARVLRLTRREE